MSSTLDPLPRSSGELAFASGARTLGADMGPLRVLVLYPHARCNCRCRMCDIWKRRDETEIDPEDLRAELPELVERGLERVVLSGGEPLMHGRLEELLRALSEAGLGITIVTTGLLLREHAALVLRHADDLVVSLDGPAEVHDRIRRIPDAFAGLADGVRAIREASESAGVEISIAGRCTVQRLNCQHLGDTVTAARGIGLDAISFLAVDVSSEAFDRPGGWSPARQSAVLPSLAQVEALEPALDDLEAEHRSDFEAGFIVERPEKLRARLLDHFRAAHGLAPFRAPRCNAPWVSAVVESDGRVRPCFFHTDIGRWSDDSSIASALDSARARSFRAALDVASNPTCARCVCSLNLEVGASETLDVKAE